MPDTRLFDPEFVADPPRRLPPGTQHCLGAGPARAELTIALRTLAQRYPPFTVVEDDVRWAMPRLMVKHSVSLPVIVCR